MQIQRAGRLCISLMGILALSACSTFAAYPGARRGESGLAVVAGYTRNVLVFMASARVTAVDGVRPSNVLQEATSSSMLPGRHWIEMTEERYFGGSHGITVCAVEFELEADHRYQLEANSIRPDVSWLRRPPGAPYVGSMAFKVTAPGTRDEVQSRRATCMDGGGSFCRQASDCSARPDVRCLPQRGVEIGMCGFEPR